MASAEPEENTPNPEETMENIPEVDVGADGTAEQNIRNSGDGGSSGPLQPDEDKNSGDQSKDKEKINKALDDMMNNIRMVEDIPECLHGESLTCLKEETKQTMMYFLDPESDVMTGDGKCKDYRGVAEWANLDTAFCKYITDIGLKNKINDVLSMWIKGSDERRIPDPTIGNLRKCLIEIDRPDALSTLAPKIAMDAIAWQKTRLEAHTNESQKQDTSWQLTRHDVAVNRKTFYTCCLVFADQDEGMARLIMRLFTKCHPDTLFFLPQFDLKGGKYEKQATAKVIQERCGGKVVFLVSEYFAASPVCLFTVQFCKELDMESNEGNLLPVILSNNELDIPHVLRGIHGLKWYNRVMRRRFLEQLVESVLRPSVTPEEYGEIKTRLETLLSEHEREFLCDPPYAQGIPPPQPRHVFYPEPDPPLLQNAFQPPNNLDIDDDDALIDIEVTLPAGQNGTARKGRNGGSVSGFFKRLFSRKR